MSLSAITFWIDYEKRRLIESFTSTAAAATPVFTQGDTIPVEVHLVRQKGSAREEIGFPAGSTLKIGVGRLESLPTSGSFILGYKADQTAPLAWNASASDIQTALNALASVSSEGGVEVSQAGDAFLILWNTGTTHDPFSGDPDELFPPSNISLASQVLGDSQRTLLHLQQSPIAYLDDFQSMDAPAASMTLISTSGTKRIYRLEIDPSPAGGTFVISSTVGATTQDSNAISVEALASNLQTLLPPNAQAGASVIKSGSYSWDISVALEVTLAVDDSGLIPWLGKQGRITLATAEVHQFLAGASSGSAFLEILLEEAEGETTLVQTQCRIQADMIDEGLINPVPLSPPFAEATGNLRYVRRDLDQNPDAATQDQIWENLGVSLDGSDVVAAINASSSPSSGNPFVTASAVNGLVSGFAPINSPTFTGTVTIPSGALISGYLTQASASSTYLTQTSAATIYLSQASANVTYVKKSNAEVIGSLQINPQTGTYPGKIPLFYQTPSAWTITMADSSTGGSGPDGWFTSGSVGIQDFVSDLSLPGGARLSLLKQWTDGSLIQTQKSVEIEGQGIYFDGIINNNRLHFSTDSLIFTKKITGTPASGKAGINIGIGGTSTDATTPGDLWITSGGTSLNFRDASGSWRQCLSTSSAGAITTTSINPVLTITQNGTGRAFVVQDGSANPDLDCFIIDNAGNLGVGVSNGASPWVASHKVEVNGAIKADTITFDGSAQFKVNSVSSHSSGSNTHDLFLSYGGSTYRIPMIFVSTP